MHVFLVGVDLPSGKMLTMDHPLKPQLERLDVQQFVVRLAQADLPMDAIVLGPTVRESLQLAQQIAAVNKDVALLLLRFPHELAALKQAVSVTPILGPIVECWHFDDTHDWFPVLQMLLQRIQQRRQHRSMIAAANARIASFAPAPIYAAHYLDRLLEVAPIGVITLDSHGAIRAANVMAGTILSTPPAALHQQPLRTLFPASMQQALDDLLTETHASPHVPQHGMLERLGQDALPQFVEVHTAALHEGVGGPETLLIFQDVTPRIRAEQERAQAEATIRAQQEWFRVTLASIGDAVIASDPAGRVTFMNPIAETLTGWTLSEALGAPLEHIFHIVREDTYEVVENPVTKVLQTGTVVGVANHTLLIRRNGSPIPIDDSGAPIVDAQGTILGVVLVFRDVTERRRQEQVDHLLAMASRSLMQSLDYTNTMQQVVRLVVPMLADWCWLEMIHPDPSLPVVAWAGRDATIEGLLQELTDAPVLWRSVPSIVHLLHDGSVVQIPSHSDDSHIHVQALVNPTLTARMLMPQSLMLVPLRLQEELIGVLTLALITGQRSYGVTERKIAEALTEQATSAIVQARLYHETQAALQARDQFLSIASHELRTPLTSLLGYLELLYRRSRREQTLNARDQRALQVTIKQAQRLRSMVEMLLDLSRIQTGQLQIEPEPLDLCQLIKRIGTELQPMVDQHMLEVVTLTDELWIEGDALRLEQVVHNLVQNAVKYSAPGSRILIQVGQQEHYGYVAITDQGIGIPEHALPHLFQRFYRASNVDPLQISGLGIGLYVVKELVSLHGGHVSVESREGQGSTFTVWLPVGD